MAGAGVMELTGDREVLSALRGLVRKAQDRVAKQALTKGAVVVARAARKLQKHSSLRSLIGHKTMTRKRDKEPIAKVYLKPSKDRTIQLEGRTVGFEVVGNILEFGSVKQKITPQPFMRPALAQSQSAAMSAVAEEARKRLTQLGAI